MSVELSARHHIGLDDSSDRTDPRPMRLGDMGRISVKRRSALSVRMSRGHHSSQISPGP
jgi:hypothetical protein